MIVADETFSVKPQKSPRRKATPKTTNDSKLTLCAGDKVKVKSYGKRPPEAPPPPVLTIGKLVSLELTLAQFGIEPNARTVRRIDGVK